MFKRLIIVLTPLLLLIVFRFIALDMYFLGLLSTLIPFPDILIQMYALLAFFVPLLYFLFAPTGIAFVRKHRYCSVILKINALTIFVFSLLAEKVKGLCSAGLGFVFDLSLPILFGLFVFALIPSMGENEDFTFHEE